MNETAASGDRARGPSHAAVFVWLLAVSAIWHYTSSSTEILSYWFRYDAPTTPFVLLSIASALIGACFPGNTTAVLVFAVGQLISLGARFPFVADHLVMELAIALAIVLSYASLAVRQRTWRIPVTAMFDVFAPAARWLLVIMYFFGVFHKLNPGFMSIESSCAVGFVQGFPLPQFLLDQSWVNYAAIYGALLVELGAMLLLLTARGKYYGMLLGMSFHFAIGISDFGTMAHFSAFAMALHALFLPSSFGERVCTERAIPAFLKRPQQFRIVTLLLIALQIALAMHLQQTREGALVNGLFTVFGLGLLYLVFRHGQLRRDDAPYRLRSPLLMLNLIPAWFFVYCASPYIGLGTGGTLAMFSGLRTEGGISNHYLIEEPLPLFHYQDKIVYVEDAQNPSLRAAMRDGQGIVLFDFQRHFTYIERLALPLALRVDDQRYDIRSFDDFVVFANEQFTAQSWLERKYMSFRLVDDARPTQCRH
jgi:multisubunit Na+/H+ antiporter MnhB subunit